jgi:hypothetical protein
MTDQLTGPEMQLVNTMRRQTTVRTTVQIILALGIIAAFVFTNLGTRRAVQELQAQGDDISVVAEAVQLTRLVESWDIIPKFIAVVAGEEAMRFTGDFICADSLPIDLFIQFRSSINQTIDDGIIAPNLIRTVQLPLEAEKVCNLGPTEFVVPWSQVDGWEAIDAPTPYRLIITAEAVSHDNFIEARVESAPFTILPIS